HKPLFRKLKLTTMKKIYLFLAAAITCSINLKAQTVSKLYGTAGYQGTTVQPSAAISNNNSALYGPANIYVDLNGRARITELLGNRLRMLEYMSAPATVYTRAGSLLSSPGSADGTGLGSNGFTAPAGIVVDSLNGYIYISDAGNNCIR